ncbi:hypothetical protein Csa_023585, partial [Cucumis sativus]
YRLVGIDRADSYLDHLLCLCWLSHLTGSRKRSSRSHKRNELLFCEDSPQFLLIKYQLIALPQMGKLQSSLE